MPEIVTKYPDITLKLLTDANINCGRGAEQKILTACPKDKFCSLPTGEMCVYGILDIPKMTQISTREIVALPSVMVPILIALFMAFFLGLCIGILIKKK